MNLGALLIGVVIIAAAIRNTHQQLFGALAQDVPAFMVWAAAIFTVGALGYIPGMKPVSRGLLALVLVVIVLRNYETILAGFAQRISDTAGSTGAGQSGGAGGGGGGGGISFDPSQLGDILGGQPGGLPWPVLT